MLERLVFKRFIGPVEAAETAVIRRKHHAVLAFLRHPEAVVDHAFFDAEYFRYNASATILVAANISDKAAVHGAAVAEGAIGLSHGSFIAENKRPTRRLKPNFQGSRDSSP